MFYQSPQWVIAQQCALLPNQHESFARMAMVFISHHQILFMLPCACAIGFMITCTI